MMFHFHEINTLADAALPRGAVGIKISDGYMAHAILDGGGSNLTGDYGELRGESIHDWAGYAAVDIARVMLVQLYCYDADAEAHVAFQRPDLDACAAAAILVLCALRLVPQDETHIRERIRSIAEPKDLTAIAAVCSQSGRPLGERVAIVAYWLLHDERAYGIDPLDGAECRPTMEQVYTACGARPDLSGYDCETHAAEAIRSALT